MSRASNFSYERGFTLVETLIYTALVALLLLVIVQMVLSSAASYRHSNAYLDINSAALSAFGAFSRDIRQAVSVDATSSALDMASGRLFLNTKDANGETGTVELYLNAGKVRVDQDGLYLGDLTPSNITVSNLTFRLLTAATTSAVRVEMTVAPRERAQVPALSFYGTYVLRASYIK
ncbi:MAG: prepilin-type N-terminal cleavage/methylation domain-containing protein [Candidatus Paceibacterota bacterium]|jgi:type II secretory pathway pseudopilin PulG